jgi:hypothetical protein
MNCKLLKKILLREIKKGPDCGLFCCGVWGATIGTLIKEI